LPEKVSKAIFNDETSKANIKIMPRSSLQTVIENDAVSMCGTDTTDPEKLCSWVISTGDLSDYNNPMRLEAMKYMATIELIRHWVRYPGAYTLGGYDNGALGACCTVVPMYHGYKATETMKMKMIPFVATTELMVKGQLPGTFYKKEYREWRKALMARLFGKNGMEEMQSRTHGKYGAGPHIYISMMMVHPAFQGKGLCGRLMRAACRAADAERLPTYLETAGDRNVAVYKRFGFQVVEKTTISAEGYGAYDEVYLMVREFLAADGPVRGS